MRTDGAIITNAGQELLSYALANNKQVNFTKVKLGKGDVNTFDEAKKLTDVVSFYKQIPITSIARNNAGIVRIRSSFTNADFPLQVVLKEIGVFAVVEGKSEVLFGYVNDGEGESFPPGSSGNIVERVRDIYVGVSTNTQVTAVVDRSVVYATIYDLDEEIAKCAKKITRVNPGNGIHGGGTLGEDITVSIKSNDTSINLDVANGITLKKTTSWLNDAAQLFTAKGALDLFNTLTTNFTNGINAAKEVLRLDIVKKLNKGAYLGDAQDLKNDIDERVPYYSSTKIVGIHYNPNVGLHWYPNVSTAYKFWDSHNFNPDEKLDRGGLTGTALELKNWLVTNYTTLMNNIRDTLSNAINTKLSHGGYGATAQDLKNEVDTKVSKNGDTLNGILTSNATSMMVSGVTGMHLHSNSDQIGFLNRDGNWMFRTDQYGTTLVNGSIHTGGNISIANNAPIIELVENDTGTKAYLVLDGAGGRLQRDSTAGSNIFSWDSKSAIFNGLSTGNVNRLGDNVAGELTFTSANMLKSGVNAMRLYANSSGIGFLKADTSWGLLVDKTGNISTAGNVDIASGSGVYFGGKRVLQDHGNGDITLSGRTGDLYIGYNNPAHGYSTRNVSIDSPIQKHPQGRSVSAGPNGYTVQEVTIDQSVGAVGQEMICAGKSTGMGIHQDGNTYFWKGEATTGPETKDYYLKVGDTNSGNDTFTVMHRRIITERNQSAFDVNGALINKRGGFVSTINNQEQSNTYYGHILMETGQGSGQNYNIKTGIGHLRLGDTAHEWLSTRIYSIVDNNPTTMKEWAFHHDTGVFQSAGLSTSNAVECHHPSLIVSKVTGMQLHSNEGQIGFLSSSGHWIFRVNQSTGEVVNSYSSFIMPTGLRMFSAGDSIGFLGTDTNWKFRTDNNGNTFSEGKVDAKGGKLGGYLASLAGDYAGLKSTSAGVLENRYASGVSWNDNPTNNGFDIKAELGLLRPSTNPGEWGKITLSSIVNRDTGTVKTWEFGMQDGSFSCPGVVTSQGSEVLTFANANRYCPHRVGDIIESTSAEHPASTWLGTQWERYGNGMVVVGVSETEVEFASAGQTGGAKYVSLTEAQNGPHTHTLTSITGGSGWYGQGGNLGGFGGVTTSSSGSGESHNNLQPYVALYRWRRVA